MCRSKGCKCDLTYFKFSGFNGGVIFPVQPWPKSRVAHLHTACSAMWEGYRQPAKATWLGARGEAAAAVISILRADLVWEVCGAYADQSQLINFGKRNRLCSPT